MNLTPLDIRKQEFGKALVGGCNRDEVEGFLGMVADEVEKLLKEKVELRDRVGRLEASLEEHAQLERTLRDTLTTAQQAMDDARSNARKEAEMIVREANAKARGMIAEAQERAKRMIVEVQEGVRETQEQMHRLEDRRDAFVTRLKALFNAQMELIETLGRVPAPAVEENRSERSDDEGGTVEDRSREEDGESEDTAPSSSVEG